MRCPRCGSSTKVLETRRPEDDASLRRRRACTSCDHRFTTFERAEPSPLFILKRDGRRQPFDRTKLSDALLRASHKRDVDPQVIEAIAGEVETEARLLGDEISSSEIGRLCLEKLEPVDRGAFLQFAGTLPDELAPELGNRGFPPVRSVRDGEDAHSSLTDTGSTEI